MRGAWVFLPPRDTSHGAAPTGSQISLFSSPDLFGLSGFPNCSNGTVSSFSYLVSLGVNTNTAPGAMFSSCFIIVLSAGLIKTCCFLPPGDRCEFDRRQGRCVPGVCRNGGTCLELSGGGFRCECPAGSYERPYCTVTARSFPPKSFAMFRGLRQRFHLTISLT